ncbi:MAG: hypothetical protein HY606_12955 [Planctomycetes bacterium]|nr:hypothetical protein [Planctomycetota bacterium]
MCYVITMFAPGKIRAICIIIAVVLGCLDVYGSRFDLNADGIAYIEMAEAHAQGDWNKGVSTHWQFLYPLLLAAGLLIFNPTPYWEFPLIYFTNFLVYLFAIFCLDYFLRMLIRYRKQVTGDQSVLSELSIIVIGYSLFLYSALALYSMASTNVDLLLTGIMCLSLAMILKISMGSTGMSTFALLGVLLGVGYLAKQIMLPVGIIFLLTAFVAFKNKIQSIPKILFGLLVFLVVCSVYVISISVKKGHFTLADTGPIAYCWKVESVLPYFHPDEISNKMPHPPRKIHDEPAVYEFSEPVDATYPLIFNPAYWEEGLKPRYDPAIFARVFLGRLLDCFSLFFAGPLVGLLILLIVVYSSNGRGWGNFADIMSIKIILIPILAFFLINLLVAFEPRYIIPIIPALFLSLFVSVRIPDPKVLLGGASAVAAVFLCIISLKVAFNLLFKDHRHIQWEIGQLLKESGVQSGDKIAVVRGSGTEWWRADWARYSGVKIAAEIHPWEGDKFSKLSDGGQIVLKNKLSSVGIKAIFAQTKDAVQKAGWKKLDITDRETNYYIYQINNE